MASFKILGVDPGVRKLGFGVINFDEESEKITVENCGVLKVPVKFKGNEALLYMKNELIELFGTGIFKDIDKLSVEVPRASFGAIQAWALIPIGVVAGLVMGFFDVDDIALCSPAEWNRAKKKDKTHAELQKELGDVESWGFYHKPKNAKDHEHILDAIGIARWLLKRDHTGE